MLLFDDDSWSACRVSRLVDLRIVVVLEQVERLMDDAGYARLEQYLSLRRLSLVGATLDSWLRRSAFLATCAS